jgi:hypothetical protein
MNLTALELPHDVASATHAVCLSLHEMMLGEPEAASNAYQRIDGIEPEMVTEFAQVLLTLLRLAAPELAARASQSYRAGSTRLKQAVQDHSELLQHDTLLKSIYKQVRVLLAEAYGKKLTAWWIRLVG